MPIVGGLDIHRKQITFDYLDTATGEVQRGQIAPADRAHLRSWLARFAGRDDVAFALEGCTGWRYVAEELAGAGVAAHVAEPADTAFARGRKRHAKTDKTDSRHLRELLAEGRLPECWIPPSHILECRALLETYHDLRAEHTAWVQRIHAVFFHQGAPRLGESVVVMGFPFSGLLSSDAVVTTGIVSALAGMRDDRHKLQISAPVQPGNSGGPLLDPAGHLVGVVVSKLDGVRMASLTGAIPENINFAIKGEEARSFLRVHGVAVVTAPKGKDLTADVIAEQGLRYTVRLECWK